MTVDELWRYAYVKKPLTEIYSALEEVPESFKIEWIKDKYDYVRTHTDDEIEMMSSYTPEQIMDWLEEAAPFAREAALKAFGYSDTNNEKR